MLLKKFALKYTAAREQVSLNRIERDIG